MELDKHVKVSIGTFLITLIIIVLLTAIIAPEQLWLALILSLYSIVIALLVGYMLIRCAKKGE